MKTTMIKKIVAAASLLAAACTFADTAEIVNVEGRGVGASKAEALKDAYRDAVERAVGMYVDAEQKMKNEELVEDQILTQSNAYIEKYEVVKEKAKPNGLVEIRINAEVKKSALTKKLSDVMPKQTFALGDDAQNIHSRVVTKEKRNGDAAVLLENVLKDVNPVKQLMKLSLADTKPILKSVDGRFVRDGRAARRSGEKNRVSVSDSRWTSGSTTKIFFRHYSRCLTRLPSSHRRMSVLRPLRLNPALFWT